METTSSKDLELFRTNFVNIETELAKTIVGNRELARLILVSIFSGGHVLLEGAPGLGKTLLVKSLAEILGLSFKRIQFTSDLLPSDITGTQYLVDSEQGGRKFEFKKGPIFANIILADEINRTGPKTQSALLEAMEEKQVTVLGQTYPLPQPFLVIATQNPIELEGTYPLPEAQLDRFLFKLNVKFPLAGELKEILRRTTTNVQTKLNPFISENLAADVILGMKRLARQVLVASPLEDVLVGIIYALSPESKTAPEFVKKYVKFGPGPRGAQAVLLAAKVLALIEGRVNISYADINTALAPALRHRLILNYQAELDDISADKIIETVKQ